eukprot:Platyproteum_vivax@DN2666_c0_g1_i1.p1
MKPFDLKLDTMLMTQVLGKACHLQLKRRVKSTAIDAAATSAWSRVNREAASCIANKWPEHDEPCNVEFCTHWGPLALSSYTPVFISQTMAVSIESLLTVVADVKNLDQWIKIVKPGGSIVSGPGITQPQEKTTAAHTMALTFPLAEMPFAVTAQLFVDWRECWCYMRFQPASEANQLKFQAGVFMRPVGRVRTQVGLKMVIDYNSVLLPALVADRTAQAVALKIFENLRTVATTRMVDQDDKSYIEKRRAPSGSLTKIAARMQRKAANIIFFDPLHEHYNSCPSSPRAMDVIERPPNPIAEVYEKMETNKESKDLNADIDAAIYKAYEHLEESGTDGRPLDCQLLIEEAKLQLQDRSSLVGGDVAEALNERLTSTALNLIAKDRWQKTLDLVREVETHTVPKRHEDVVPVFSTNLLPDCAYQSNVVVGVVNAPIWMLIRVLSDPSIAWSPFVTQTTILQGVGGQLPLSESIVLHHLAMPTPLGTRCMVSSVRLTADWSKDWIFFKSVPIEPPTSLPNSSPARVETALAIVAKPKGEDRTVMYFKTQQNFPNDYLPSIITNRFLPDSAKRTFEGLRNAMETHYASQDLPAFFPHEDSEEGFPLVLKKIKALQKRVAKEQEEANPQGSEPSSPHGTPQGMTPQGPPGAPTSQASQASMLGESGTEMMKTVTAVTDSMAETVGGVVGNFGMMNPLGYFWGSSAETKPEEKKPHQHRSRSPDKKEEVEEEETEKDKEEEGKADKEAEKEEKPEPSMFAWGNFF